MITFLFLVILMLFFVNSSLGKAHSSIIKFISKSFTYSICCLVVNFSSFGILNLISLFLIVGIDIYDFNILRTK